MEHISLNATRGLKFHRVSADRALHTAPHLHLLCDEVARSVRALVDDDALGVNVDLHLAVDLKFSLAVEIASNRKTGANNGRRTSGSFALGGCASLRACGGAIRIFSEHERVTPSASVGSCSSTDCAAHRRVYLACECHIAQSDVWQAVQGNEPTHHGLSCKSAPFMNNPFASWTDRARRC